ncbi:LysR family transcriptional regulator [Azohydromonas lata]|uniref:LysR family transcriptional regulator n=1 Tax=Azohydromonas lata TaxID=45677 RepID=A0ABU5IHT5_9BURK|nr:LysR family transcriptional regulator [Azohydromonas lata]MDZ5458727.1 LysR family transcriptional regulator [Azohydromonas lata]
MGPDFSYRHLHYFWVVAQEGGMARGAARLGVAVQTVSAQVRELERALGHTLLRPEGRGLALTDAGQAALRQADQIFALGEQLPAVVQEAAGSPVVRLTVGLCDGLPKLMVHRLLMPVLAQADLRLLCHDGEFEELLAALALHKLDLVLADHPAPPHPGLRIQAHPLSRSAIAWYATPALQAAARDGFPQSLARLPVLLPTGHAAMRATLERWFEQVGVRPRVAGEFEDSALLKTFGAAGLGVFPAVELVDEDLRRHYGVECVGRCDEAEQRFYAFCSERKVQHPLVQRVLAAAAG